MIDLLFLESFKGWSDLIKFVFYSKIDEQIRDFIGEYQLKYAIEGWNILSSYFKIAFLVSLSSSIVFLGLNHPVVIRQLYLMIIMLIASTLLGLLIKKYKFFRDNLFIFVLLLQGFGVIHGNFKGSNYYFYEFWISYWYLSQFVSIYMCLSWKKILITHWFIVTVFDVV